MKGFTIALVLMSVACASVGQVFLKLGSTGQARAADFVNVQNGAGLGLYVAGTVLWMFALAQAPLQQVYPFTMLTLVVVGGLSYLVLGEQPSGQTIVGWLVVLAGLGIITSGVAK